MRVKFIFLFFLYAAVTICPVLADTTQQPKSTQPLDPALKVIADHYIGEIIKSGRRAGMVVGIINGDNKWIIGYGKRALDNNTPPDGNTLYEIGSVSKTFTATALAIMANNGLVKLTDPVGKYLPKGTSLPSRKNKQITLENLATHTSGLPRMPDNFVDNNPSPLANPYSAYSSANMYKFLSAFRLKQNPGSKYDYSNLGAGLLGLALSRTRASSYEKMITELICKPLGMNDTVISLSNDQRARLAPAYALVSKRKNINLTKAANWTFQDCFAGAGAIRSTANDMLTYIAANVGVQTTPLKDAINLTHKPRHKISDELSIGLSWHIIKLPAPTSGTIFIHDGGTGGYNSFVGFSKEHKVGVVVLSNGTLADGSDSEEDTIGTQLLVLLMHPELLK